MVSEPSSSMDHGGNVMAEELVVRSLPNKKNQLKVPKKIHKAEREKLKRDQLNELFLALGYALEYAYTMRVTMAGNVYSFGVILLELLTGKPPVNQGVELVKWALSSSGTLDPEQILDSSVCRTSFAVRSQMLSVLKVALSCVSSSPEARPNMRSVSRMLVNAKSYKV